MKVAQVVADTVSHINPTVKDQVSAAEWQARVAPAACYRLVAMHGWDHLINPYSMTLAGMTASSLVKVDLSGKK